MTKKLLSLLLAVSMILSVCAVGVMAEETGEIIDPTETTAATDESTTGSSEETTPEGDEETTAPDDDEDEVVAKSVDLNMANAYYPNATVTISGTVTGDVSVVLVEILCDEDRVEETSVLSASKFESAGVEYELDDATVGAEYVVNVYDDDTDELIGSGSFLIKKATTSTDSVDDGSNKVTIWVEGTSARYIDKTVVNLSVLDDPTVFDLAEYLLEEEDREFKDNKKKITAIASTATGSTYTLKDNSTSKYFDDCVWGFFKNGVAVYEDDWTEIEVTGGDEIVLYYGEPGEVGYPILNIDPDADFSANDVVEFEVLNRITDPESGEVTEEPVKGAKISFVKRGSEKGTSMGSTGTDGTLEKKITSSMITSYQGGEIMVSYYQSSTKPIKMVSVKTDLKVDRDGAIQAYVRIEGAHKTLLKRTKSAKIEEYDLYNFMLEVLEDEDIEYEANDDENNFIYFEAKSTSGYSNENGDITRDSGWYVVVNDEIYTPDEDLEDVEIYPNDEILFYFGDEDTVPVVYYKIDGDLKTDKRVYVYFYSDSDMTNPIDDLDVYFDGDEYNDKRLTTKSDGKVTLPTVEYKGKYTLYWGEQVGVKDEKCPEAIYGEVELSYTGTSKTTSGGTSSGGTSSKDDDDDDEITIQYKCDQCGDTVTKVYTVEYNYDYLDVCKDCRTEINAWKKAEEEKKEEETTTPDPWEKGEYDDPKEEETDFIPGPSKYYPDQNIDSWAVANINKAHEYKLMSGTAKGYFEPQREITRAEFTAIICRILDLDTEASYEQKFADVKPSDWHYGYVMAAYSAGYVNGMSETSFAPSNYITREEIAVMISRILNVTGNEADVYQFADGQNVAAWARIYVAAVNQTGIMTGDQFGQFLPKNQVNRQTVATIAVRLYEYLRKN